MPCAHKSVTRGMMMDMDEFNSQGAGDRKHSVQPILPPYRAAVFIQLILEDDDLVKERRLFDAVTTRQSQKQAADNDVNDEQEDPDQVKKGSGDEKCDGSDRQVAAGLDSVLLLRSGIREFVYGNQNSNGLISWLYQHVEKECPQYGYAIRCFHCRRQHLAKDKTQYRFVLACWGGLPSSQLLDVRQRVEEHTHYPAAKAELNNKDNDNWDLDKLLVKGSVVLVRAYVSCLSRDCCQAIRFGRRRAADAGANLTACSHCGEFLTARKAKWCARCHGACYCDQDCQRAELAYHKLHCVSKS